MTIVIILLVILLLFGLVAFVGAPYVPSKPREVRRALNDLYPLGIDDHLVDIGSGDGLVLRIASRQGARATGYELNPVLVAISRWLSRRDDRVSVKLANFWYVDLPEDTTVCYVFGDGRDIDRIAARVQRAANASIRSIALVSYGFELRDYTVERTLGAHHLYRITPEALHRGQP